MRKAIFGLITYLYILRLSVAQIFRVTIDPYYANTYLEGSIYGGLRIYIKGAGFDPEGMSNEVFVGNIPCSILHYYTTETQIVCQMEEGTYTAATSLPLKIYVSGTEIPCILWNCSVLLNSSASPYIVAVVPSAIYPGQTLKALGYLRSSTTKEILQIKIGRQNCNLPEDAESLDPWSTAADVSCATLPDLEIGEHNLRFESKYGTGYAKVMETASLFNLSTGNKYHVRVHPLISELSSSDGYSTGQILTIKGLGFGTDKEKVTVDIDGISTKILSVDRETIKVELGASTIDENQMYFIGGAGLDHKFYRLNQTFTTFMNRADYPEIEGHVQDIKLTLESYVNQNTYIQRYRGVFKAPKSGIYKFYMSSDNQSELRISKTAFSKTTLVSDQTDFDRLCYITSWSNWRNFFQNVGVTYCEKEMVAGEYYHLLALHQQYGDQDHMNLRVNIPNSDTEVPNRVYQVNMITVTNTPVEEQIIMKIWNAESGTYKLLFQLTDNQGKLIFDKITANITWPTTAAALKTAISDATGWSSTTITRKNLDGSGNELNITNLTDEEIAAQTKGYAFYITFNFIRSERVAPFLVNTGLVKVQGASNVDFFQQVLVQPSTPVTGTFKLKIGSYTSDAIDVSLREEAVVTILHRMPNLTNGVIVRTSGDTHKVKTFYIELVSLRGQVIEVEFVDNLVVGGPVENPVQIANQIRIAASDDIFSPSLPSELLYTISQKPQVRVAVNGLYAACPGYKCDYNVIAPDQTPFVESFSTNELTLDIILDARYDTLDDVALITADNLAVEFGGSVCSLIIVSLPNITCTLPKNDDDTPIIEAGDHKPKVHLNNRGFFDVSAAAISFDVAITSISPIMSGSKGGMDITITGSGFGPSAEVKINDTICTIKKVTNQTLICKVPPNSTDSDDTTTSLTINTKTVTKDSDSFTYDASLTPVITSLSPKSASPVLKSTLTINGTAFGTDISKLKVTLKRTTLYKDKKIEFDCNVLTAADNKITCRLGGGFSGTYKVIVTTSDRGDNDVQDVDDDIFTYEITVISVTPTSGSTQGGTELVITGTNFSTITNSNQIIIGPKDLYCDITSATETQLTCVTRPMDPNMSGDQDVDVLGKIVEKGVCKGTCKFTYDDDSTPKVTTVSSNSVVSGDIITLTGTNLGTDDIVQVTLGNLSATVTSQSDTEIVFTVPQYPASVRALNVLVPNKGYAKFTTITPINNKFSYIDVTPKTGNRGGNILTVTGNGFDSTKVKVYAGANKTACTIISMTPTEIKCYLPALGNSSTIYSITVEQDAIALNCSGCEYTTSTETPFITSISTHVFDTPASISFTISGSLLTSVDPANVTVLLKNRKVATIEIQGSATYTQQVNNTGSITLSFTDVPVGLYDIRYFIKDVGFIIVATSTNYITVNFNDSITINNIVSSFNGGSEVVITGAGFTTSSELFSVTICGRTCILENITYNEIKCLTPTLITETSNDSFNLAQSGVIKPVLITQSQISNITGLTDTNFATSISSSSNTCSFVFDYGAGNMARVAAVRFFPTLNSDEKYLNGALILGSNDGTNFDTLATLVLTIENWNEYKPNSGTWNYRYIKFQGKRCRIAEFEVQGYVYYNEVAINLESHKCGVVVKTETKTITKSDVVEYKLANTPLVSSISPKLGTTAGGTILSIAGERFDPQNSEIIIDGILCPIDGDLSSSTLLVCTTGARPEFVDPTFVIKTPYGLAATQDLTYLYIDRWSEVATWGGEALPMEGDGVYVPKGQNLLVDVSTPILVAVIVEGSIIWEDEKDMTFDAHYIFVRGGSFNIGTPTQPHLHKLVVTLHGEKSDMTMPDMGNKLIGAFTGTVDIHGKKRQPTWTLLGATVLPGATTLTLVEPVDWEVGEIIIITPTDTNREHFEFLTIVNVSNDNLTVEFTPPLLHAHFADTLEYDGKFFEVRAEVALMTRNVIIQGDENSVNTKYGVHVMMRGRGVKGRFSYIEVTRCGQAFQMGRYPLHFHMVGNVIGSYIEGCSVHHSFNRGSTIHGVHYLQVKKNVYYQHLGHGIFIEDSVESNNIIEENLIMHTSISSSLLISDLKPAGIWITRPNNFITKNRACGSQSFGFWFELPSNPTGPSAVDTICISGEPLGTFADNTAHTNGIGLRIYPIYIPRTNACASFMNENLADPFADNPPVLAEFNNILVFSNNKGFFGRNIGAIKLENFGIISNGNGIAVAEPNFAPINMPRLINSVVVSVSPLTTLHGISTGEGFRSGRNDGFMLDNVVFINFSNGYVFTTCEGCESQMHLDRGARLTTFKNIRFENVTSNFIGYNDAKRDKDIFKDVDGSLGKFMGFPASTGGWIVPYMKHLDTPQCTKIEDIKICNEPCLYCTDAVDIRRIDIVLTSAQSLLRGLTLKIFNLGVYNDFSVDITNENNFSLVAARDIKSFMGWSVPYISGYEYNLHWQNGVDYSVIDISNNLTWLTTDKAVTLRFNNTNPRELYDIIYTGIEDATSISNKIITASTVIPGVDKGFGDHFYKDNLLHVKIDRKLRRGNAKVQAVICRKTCPGDPGEAPPEDTFRYWSKPENWQSGKVPVDGEDVIIEPAWRMILDVPTAKLKSLKITGSLIADAAKINLVINAFNVHITTNGSLTVGTDTAPFTNPFTLNLFGTFISERIVIGPVIEPANKALIVAGELRLYGVKRTVVWTRLRESALKGTSTIKLTSDTDWAVGDDIVIASSSMDPNEVEYAKIKTKTDARAFELTTALLYDHYGSANSISTQYGTLDMRTEVGVLTRNIKIIGANDSDWGCRVLTARYQVYDNDLGSLVWIEGRSIMQGVEISGCGQRDTLHGSLDFQYLQGNDENIIDNVVIRNGVGIGVNMINTKNIRFVNSIITNVRKYGVHAQLVNNLTFEDNLIVKIVARPAYSNSEVSDLHIGFYYNDLSTLAERNVNIHRNSISASDWFAWLIPGHACNTINANFKGNIGHTSRGGWFGGNSATDCAAYSDFIGYKNFDEGFVNRFEIHKLYVSNMILADNANSIAINGGSSSARRYPIASLKDSIIYGKALTDCTFCYKTPKECRTNGVYTSLFEIGIFDLKFNEFRLPLHNTTNTDYLWGGKQYIENVAFRNFQPTPVCSESYTIRSNNFVQDTSVAVYLKNIELTNVLESNYFYFFNHTKLNNPLFCGKRDCTGIYNLILFDQSGNYYENQSNIFGYNRGIAKDGNCTFKVDWNGHACKDAYMLLSMEQPASERQSVISPLDFKIYQLDANVLEAERFNNKIDNERKFPVIIKRNSYHLVEFSQSMPTGVEYKLDSADPKDWAVFRASLTDPAVLFTVVNGKTIDSLVVKEGETINLLDYKDKCGTNIYTSSSNSDAAPNTTLTWIQTADPNCLVTVVKSSTVKINMRLDINVMDFYKDIGPTSFIDRMAALLGIPIARLKIVGIRSGSTIIDFFILSKTFANGGSGETSNADLEELTTVKNTLVTKVASGEVSTIAPVLNMDASLVENGVDGSSSTTYVPSCRFYSFTNHVLFKSELEESMKSTENPATFVHIKCNECKDKKDCEELLETACHINKELIGASQCYNNFECEDCDDNDDSFVDLRIVSLLHVIFLLWIVK